MSERDEKIKALRERLAANAPTEAEIAADAAAEHAAEYRLFREGRL